VHRVETEGGIHFAGVRGPKQTCSAGKGKYGYFFSRALQGVRSRNLLAEGLMGGDGDRCPPETASK